MTKVEAKRLIPEKSYIRFGKSKYKVAGIVNHFGAWFVEIYDEPPSLHTDSLNINSVEVIKV
jgi:hypothetical protein